METAPHFQTIAAIFKELGAGDAPVSRVLLLHDRYFVGHRFHCGKLHATWKPDSSLIEFFGADGALLRTINVEVRQMRAAA